MPGRLKVLMSSFACQPDTGSEPEVGWQWAMQLARHHDITVLTREIHKAGIEQALAKLKGKQPLPEFVYLGEPAWLMAIYDRYKTFRINYFFWQRAAWKFIEELKQKQKIDLIHHVTYAGYRFGAAIWGHDIPTVWGPVGGFHSIPLNLLPWGYPPSLIMELFRYFNNCIQQAPLHMLRSRARRSTVTLTSTIEAYDMVREEGCESTLMPTIGLDVSKLPAPAPREIKGPLKLLYVGKLLTVKGIDLAIEGAARAKGDVTLTVVGDGQFMEKAKALAKRLGAAERIIFKGRVSTQEALRVYYDYHVLLFPSLGDSGGFAVIEAMNCGLPVICLDRVGPKMAVRHGGGKLVSMGTREQVVEGLARAIEYYDQHRDEVIKDGKVAREVVAREYDWEKKALQMLPIYERAVQK